LSLETKRELRALSEMRDERGGWIAIANSEKT